MTREEILDKSANLYSCRHIGRYRDSALLAMDDYAKQSAIELLNWLVESDDAHVAVIVKPFHTTNHPNKIYELFQQSKTKK